MAKSRPFCELWESNQFEENHMVRCKILLGNFTVVSVVCVFEFVFNGWSLKRKKYFRVLQNRGIKPMKLTTFWKKCLAGFRKPKTVEFKKQLEIAFVERNLDLFEALTSLVSFLCMFLPASLKIAP